MSKWTTIGRTFDTLRNDTVEVVFDNLGFQAYGNCQGRSSSLSEIMQIATSAVRIDVVHSGGSSAQSGSNSEQTDFLQPCHPSASHPALGPCVQDDRFK